MKAQSPITELHFLMKLQRVLSEALFVASYKYALLLALAELSVEKTIFCYNASHLRCTGCRMKTKTLPPLRVTAELRRSAESVLDSGETLSSFVLESVARNIGARRAQRAFIERGLASAERARRTGRYVAAETVMRKLSRRLDAARSGKAERARKRA